MASPEMSDEQRKALQVVAEMQTALGPGEPGVDIFGWVSKPSDVSRTTMDELEQAALVKTWLGTGYGDMLFYRLTDAGEAVLSDG